MLHQINALNQVTVSATSLLARADFDMSEPLGQF